MLPVGSPAIGDDFIDREKEMDQILSALEKDSVLLIAPRRFGKTSIMRRLEKELLSRDELCVFIEVEDIDSPQRFLSEMVMALLGGERIRRKVKIRCIRSKSEGNSKKLKYAKSFMIVLVLSYCKQ